MGSAYDPDSDAAPATGSYSATVALSGRDVSIRVPINFVTHPAVILNAACFADNVYEDTSTEKCLSNLLATGFRRLVIDLYWNPLLSQWTLCPAALPAINQDGLSTTSTPLSTSALATATSATMTSSVLSASASSLAARHVHDGRFNAVVDRAVSASSTASMAAAPITTVVPSPVAGVAGLYQIGEYQCTTTVDIDLVNSVIQGYLEATGNNLQATMSFLIVNLKAPVLVASSTTSSSLPEPSSQLLSTIINSTLASYLYTPVMLTADRGNLNASWFAVASPLYKPDLAYFSYDLNATGYAYTSDGWPNEGYAVLEKAKRILVGFGTSDFGAAQYNTSDDAQFIFSPNVLSSARQVTFASNGTVTFGCTFDNSTTSSSMINDSYAIPAQAELASNLSGVADNAAYSMSRCGLTSLLNETLMDTSADVNVTAYTNFVTSSTWSWDNGEPSDQTINENSHCAAMNLSDPAGGRWRVANCNDRYYGACRVGSEPYKWILTDQQGSYDSIDSACPDNSTFTVPQTSLENSYLYALASDALKESSTAGSELVWLNFNDLDVAGCWVTGVNARCTYTTTKSVTSRQVVVPTVVAVIVFVLAFLTIFVKCASNRKGAERSKRRLKQRDGLGEYEGVPS